MGDAWQKCSAPDCDRDFYGSDGDVCCACFYGSGSACEDCAVLLDEPTKAVDGGRREVDEERQAVVLRLQRRAIKIRSLGKSYRWAAKILEDEANAIKEGKHRE